MLIFKAKIVIPLSLNIINYVSSKSHTQLHQASCST